MRVRFIRNNFRRLYASTFDENRERHATEHHEGAMGTLTTATASRSLSPSP
jgi:hypothetical protein